MIKRKFKILNPWLLNPFFGYCLFWSLAITLYVISPSKANLHLDSGLLVFLISTIFISAFFAYKFNRRYKNKEYQIKLHRPKRILLLFLIFFYFLEFAYSKQIPLISTLTGVNSAYKDFGIPTLHVLIVTFSAFYFIYNTFIYFCFHQINNLTAALVTLIFFVLIFSRGMIIFILISATLLFLVSKKIKARHWIGLFILGFIVAWLFGILGNIRSGYEWNDTGYLLGLAKIDANPQGILSPLYWVEEYFICSLRTLNHNISISYSHSLNGLIYSVLPDFISKRIFNIGNKLQLIIPAFTTSTMYAFTYSYAGYFGMIVNFLLYVVVNEIVISIKMPNFSCKLVCFSILFFINALSIFDNMLIYSGYSFALVFAIIYGLCSKSKMKVYNKNIIQT